MSCPWTGFKEYHPVLIAKACVSCRSPPLNERSEWWVLTHHCQNSGCPGPQLWRVEERSDDVCATYNTRVCYVTVCVFRGAAPGMRSRMSPFSRFYAGGYLDNNARVSV